MKTTKIVMGMAAAAVMALSLTGCMGLGNALGNVNIGVGGKNTSISAECVATVNFENTSNEKARGMQSFANKKKGITTNITMKNLTSNSSNPGVMGLVFDKTKNSDGTYNFCLFGVRNNGGHAQAYITYFRNVAEADFTADNFGKTPGPDQTDIEGWKKGVSSANDVNGFVQLNEIKVENDELSFVVEIEALKKTASKDAENEEEFAADANNAYNVRIYKTPVTDGKVDLSKFKGLSNKTGDAKSAVTGEAIYSVVIPRASVDAANDKTIEAEMGFYANVYEGQTLSGVWNVADMKHDPNVAKTVSTEDSFIKIEY